MSAGLKWVYCRQHWDRSHFFIQSATTCLLMKHFTPLIFKLIIERYVLIAILLFVSGCFCSSSLFFCCSFSLFPYSLMIFIGLYLCFFLLSFCVYLVGFWFVFPMEFIKVDLYLLSLNKQIVIWVQIHSQSSVFFTPTPTFCFPRTGFYTLMFIVMLFTVAKRLKQLKCPQCMNE